MEDLESRLLELTEKGDWRKIIKLSECYTLTEKTKFSWAWPSESCLAKLNQVLHKNSVRSVLSIGCGSGLLEWILKEYTGIPVNGIELVGSWWTSAYSPTTFIELHFIQGAPNEQFLQDCADTIDDFALFFCYFNNRNAFDQYIEVYKGKIVVIVGPRNYCDIVTDPLPLTPKFCQSRGSNWILDSSISIDDACNVVAVYKRSD